MQVLASAPAIDVSNAAKILDDSAKSKEKNEARTKLHGEIHQLQERYDRVDELLSLDRKGRYKEAPDLYRSCYEIRAKESGAKTLGLLIQGACCAGFFIGAAAGGMGGLPFLGLIGSFWAGPPIAKGLLCTKSKVDEVMQRKLAESKTELTEELADAKERMASMKTKMLDEAIEADSEGAGIIDDDDELDFVIIDGVKLPRQKKKGIFEYILGR